MDNRTIPLLLSAFVVLIIGISLIAVVAELSINATSRTAVTNETIDNSVLRHPSNNSFDTNNVTLLANAPTGWKSNDTDCQITAANGLEVRNATGTVMTLDTDYNIVTTTGALRLLDTGAINSTSDNKTLVAYTYCGDDYLAENWNRTVLNLVGGFFALALLLTALAMFYAIMRVEGVLDI